VDVTHADAATLRKIRLHHVAMVFQQFGLLPWRTVRENVGLGLELAGQSKADRKDRVEEQLALVGLSDWADRKVGELSGGMQQRVGLARAFATDAPILLMDEPFSALDPLIRTKLQDDLLDLQAKLQRTIIFVSHDLDEAFKIGNRIAIMEGGRIVQCGTPQDIFRNPSNDYVADFVKHMNPLGVLRARDVMRSASAPEGATTVDADARVQTVMQTLVSSDADLAVTEEGIRIGVIGKNDVLVYLSDPTGGGVRN
jgi:glycine betaine/proline transport system ATP-binding protein